MSYNGNPALKDYVPVSERLQQFWSDHPNGRVITAVLNSDPIIVRAEVYRDGEDQPFASGHATDDGGMRGGSRSDSYEKTETAAVGRALAMAGYEIKNGIASREEMQRHQERQNPAKERVEQMKESLMGPKDEPKAVAAPDGKQAFGYVPVRWPLAKMFSEPMTDSQRKMIEAKATERTIPEEDVSLVRREVLEAYGLHDEPIKAHASIFIDWLINADEDHIDAAVAAAESNDDPFATI
jgi:hypothetical protein